MVYVGVLAPTAKSCAFYEYSSIYLWENPISVNPILEKTNWIVKNKLPAKPSVWVTDTEGWTKYTQTRGMRKNQLT